ncbi:MAG: SCO family protein [Nocardioides sp.]|uniref:SCO family protein n=1 Tax=Nocardioides sp. TaxID=35761 RepID=UPI0039E62113
MTRRTASSRRRTARRLAAAGVVAVLATLVSGCGSSGDETSAASSLASITQYQDMGSQPLGPATEQISQATESGTWSFSAPTGGKLTLLYFGYTSCPDVCPTTMADLASALRSLPSDQADQVWVQFVSTDPHRDTAARLTQWIHHYSPTFHAGRAPIGTVIKAARSYGIGIARPKVTRGDYQVTHGAELVVLDQQGRMVGYFKELASLKTYTAAIPTLIKDYA